MTRIKLAFGPSDVTVERRADGAMIVRSPRPLGPYPNAVTDWLDHWAKVAPTRVFLAERQGDGWRRVTYAEACDIARRIARGIVDRGLSTQRPVAILSGNSVDHALFGLAENHHPIKVLPLHRFDSFVPRMFCAGAAPSRLRKKSSV